MSCSDFVLALTDEMQEVARAAGGEAVDQIDLKIGDRFLRFRSRGKEVDPAVYVFEGGPFGFDFRKEETGERYTGLGETPIVKLPDPRVK